MCREQKDQEMNRGEIKENRRFSVYYAVFTPNDKNEDLNFKKIRKRHPAWHYLGNFQPKFQYSIVKTVGVAFHVHRPLHQNEYFIVV